MLKNKVSTVITLFTLIIITLFSYVLLKDLQGPSLNFSVEDKELGKKIGPRKEITVIAADTSGIRSITVSVKRGSKVLELYKEKFAKHPKSVEYPFTLEDAKLPEGAFTLIIKTHDASLAGFNKGNSTTKEIQLSMDNKQPRIVVETFPPSIHRGGAGLIVYKVSEETKKTGVYVGEDFFPAYEQKKGTYACLFPFPEFMLYSEYYPQIMAEDIAGNVTESRLIVNAVNKNFPEDKVKITEEFLTKKASELAKIAPDKQSTIDQYLEANGAIRKANDKLILDTFRANAGSKALWEGEFKILPRSAVMAQFGDRRTYFLDGKEIDKQVHLGFDLASVAKADVPAGNNGKVIYVGYNGIYGNMVLLDHGLGLGSLYSHLTTMNVKVGDTVKKGDILGTTGTTGLAVGDHVHFSVLVQGIFVQPKEWIDPKWVRNNISSRLSKAL